MPTLVLLNRPLALSLGLDAEALEAPPHCGVFSGNLIPTGAKPVAQNYAGHQFGHFTLLGDGRAVLLGEHLCPDGKQVDIHLKGAGLTPYSRRGDGRASLGPMLREFIISEAMHALGIPTTRSLAVATTGEQVFRHGVEPGAMLTRVASSHLRVGTFQFATAHGGTALLSELVNFAISKHRIGREGDDSPPALQLLRHCVDGQAALVASWMLVGFIHGVMNTDNMAISGETLDFGPCAFMDTYHSAAVFSSIDHHGRYAYGNQPEIALWNLTRLAESLLPGLDPDRTTAIALAESVLADFSARYAKAWSAGMRAKLGLIQAEPEDTGLFESLLAAMQEDQLDYTRTFRQLARLPSLAASPTLARWLPGWHQRLERQGLPMETVQSLMDSHNPAVIPRNHIVENVLASAVEGDLLPLQELLDALQNPYSDPANIEFTQPPSKDFQLQYQTFCGT